MTKKLGLNMLLMGIGGGILGAVLGFMGYDLGSWQVWVIVLIFCAANGVGQFSA